MAAFAAMPDGVAAELLPQLLTEIALPPAHHGLARRHRAACPSSAGPPSTPSAKRRATVANIRARRLAARGPGRRDSPSGHGRRYRQVACIAWAVVGGKETCRAAAISIRAKPGGVHGCGGILGCTTVQAEVASFLESLVRRGLGGVKLVIADAHEGLKAAIGRVFGASWQRCHVHWMRNALSYAPKTRQSLISAALCRAFVQPDRARASQTLCHVADQLRADWPRLAAFIDASEADVLVHLGFPSQHRTKIHATNRLERLNKEANRRAGVVGMFPNEGAFVRRSVSSWSGPTTNGSCSAVTCEPRRWPNWRDHRQQSRSSNFQLRRVVRGHLNPHVNLHCVDGQDRGGHPPSRCRLSPSRIRRSGRMMSSEGTRPASNAPSASASTTCRVKRLNRFSKRSLPPAPWSSRMAAGQVVRVPPARRSRRPSSSKRGKPMHTRAVDLCVNQSGCGTIIARGLLGKPGKPVAPLPIVAP